MMPPALTAYELRAELALRIALALPRNSSFGAEAKGDHIHCKIGNSFVTLIVTDVRTETLSQD